MFHSSDRNARYEIRGSVRGWFGSQTVRTTVVGRRSADLAVRRMRRDGVVNVRRSGGSWWVTR